MLNPSRSLVETTLAETFPIAPDRIEPEATLAELGLDSLSVVELLVALEERTGVRFGEHEAPPQATVAQLAATVEARLAGRDAAA